MTITGKWAKQLHSGGFTHTGFVKVSDVSYFGFSLKPGQKIYQVCYEG